VNYFGNFDAKASDALGQHSLGLIESTTVHATHVPSDAIVVSDAHLLFGAEFKRAGVDLVLSGDGREVVLHDYFKGEHRAPLASPDGAHLTGDLVTALAGQVQYAQADGNAAAGQVIGHVTKLAGTATAIRNGVSIILNNGDNVEKGDVVSSGSDSTVGITFIDGTVFGLSSNARMVLNEMVYDPNGSNNSSLLSLVAGTITFVAGETAKHGDMKVDTPVATMGIRGTAVLCEIDFSVPGATPDAKFQVLVEPDGTTGSYILFDKTTLTPLAVVDQAGMQINISNGIMSQTLAPLSPEIQKLITDVFSLKFSDSTNTKSIQNFTDSIVPNAFGLVKFALAAAPPVIPIIVNAVVENNNGPPNSASPLQHIPEAPSVHGITFNSNILEQLGVTGSTALDTAKIQVDYFDVNSGDQPTVSVKFVSFTYTSAQGQPESLNKLQQTDITAVEAITNAVNQGTLVNNNGTATWVYQVPDGALDFLGAGEKLTLTFNAIVDNNFAPNDQTGSQTFTITITGTNDVPVITSSQQNFTFAAAGTGTQGGLLPSLPSTTTTGTLNFTDVDLTDTHTASAQLVSALLDGQGIKGTTVGQTVFNELASALTASVQTDSTGTGTGAITWTLASLQVYLADFVPANESLVLTYAVTVTDSQGATSTQDVVFTIVGNEPPATVWIDTTPLSQTNGVALWSDAANWETGKTPGSGDDVIISNDQVNPKTPTFPVTVATDAAANSLTMNDFADFSAAIPTLDVESNVTLTIGGVLNLNTGTDPNTGDALPLTAEAIINNYGTISVGGIAELLKSSVLNNYGKFVLHQGGDFDDQSSITNSGIIEVSSGTLTSEVGIANSVTTIVDDSPVTVAGTIQVDGGATLKLTDGAVVTSGKVTLGSLSVLDIEKGAATLPPGTPDATLDGVTVIGTSGPTPSTIEIGVSGAATLLLDDGTSIKNGNLTISAGSALDITTSGATLDGVNVTGTNGTSGSGAGLGGLFANAGVSVTASTIEVGTTATTGTVLTLDDGTTITNGNLIIDSNNSLDIESSAGATLDGVNVTNSGTIQVDGASGPPSTTVTLVLDGGTTITGGDLLIHSLGSPGEGIVEIETGGATFDDVTVTNNNELKIDPSVTLTLTSGTVIKDGTIVDNGTILVTSSSEIENATVNGGGDITVTSGTLTLSGVTLDDVTLAGSFTNSGTLTIDETVTLNDATISGGTIKDTGTLSVTASSEIESATVDGGGDITVSGGQTLTLSGVTLDDVTLAGSFTNSDTLTIDGTVTLNGATVSSGTIDDTATGTLSVTTSSEIESATVDGGGDITVASGQTLTLSGVTLDDVTLAGSFTNSGTLTVKETVTLNGATISGGTIDATPTGTLSVSTASTIENATVDGGGNLTATSAVLTLSGVTLDNVTLTGLFTNSGTLTIDETVTFSGEITGGTIDDTGTLSVTSGVIGGTTIEGGGNLTSTSTAVSLAGVTLEDVTVAGIFTDASIVKIEETVMLDGATIKGGTIDDTGTLSVSAASTIENAIVNGGGNLTATGATLTLSDVLLDDVTLAGSFTNLDTLTIEGPVTLDDATISGGTIEDAGGSLTGTGSIGSVIAGPGTVTASGGTLTLTGDDTYAGATTIDNGATLALSGAGSISDSIDVVDNGTFDISGLTGDTSIVTLSGDGGVTLGANTLTLLDASTTFGGVIGGTGGLTLAAGTEILAGDNGYTGATTIDDGAQLTLTGSISDSSNVVDDGTLDISGTSGASIKTLSGTSTGVVTLGTETLTLTDASTTFSGAIGGTGGLTLTSGTETLAGDNGYTGATTIDDGAQLTLTGSIAKSSDVIDDGTFDISGTSGASIVTLSGTSTGIVTLGTETLTLTDASTTFSGAIGGTGGLTLTAGTEILAGDNGYTGATTIDDGAQLTLTGSISDSSNVIDDGTLDISVTSGASIKTLSGTSTGIVTLGTETLTLTDASTTFSGAIGGSGGLTLAAGTETLAGDNGYTGATTIDDGAQLTLTGSISDSSNVIDDGTLDISGTSGASIKTLSGDGTVNLGAETLTLTDPSTTFSGAIDGTGGLTVDVITVGGTGTETLTGDNLYSGVTTIDSGDTLALSDLGSIAKSSDVIDDGIFDISATSLGASILTLSGTSAGAVKLGAETLTLTNASTTFNGAIGGTGGVTLAAGTETLTGTNTFGGEATIDNGAKLALTGTGSISDSSGVADGGTFDISGLTNGGTSIKTLSGDGAVDLGANTLTLTNASTTFSGTISGTGELLVAGGTLTLATATLDGGTLEGSFSNSGTLTINNTVTLSNGTITGGTVDIVGELDSTGTSAITGALVINSSHIDIVSGTFTLDPTPFTNLGLFEVQSSATFSEELFTNSGTVGHTATNGTLQIDQNGTLTLENSTINGGIVSNSGTIDVTAASSINDTFSFVNTGTIKADGAALTLANTTVSDANGTFKTMGNGVLDLVNTIINGGTLNGKIATATGNASSTLNGLTLASSTLVTAVVGVLELTGTFANSGEFDATTGMLDLSNATIDGGTLGGDGTIATVSAFNTLEGSVTIAGGTTVSVTDGTTLHFVGAISDAGTIALGASGHFTGLEISGNVSLTGGGNVTMANDTHNFIASDGSAATLTNSDTISGAGTIGDSHLTLVNNGTIDATGSHALIIDTGVNSFTSGGLVGNLLVTNNISGVLEASAGHTLLIDDNVLNSGLIQSGNPGSSPGAFVDVTGNITGTGSIEIFNNSTIEIGGSVSSGQTVTFGAPGGPVATNGTLILDDSHDFHGTIVGLTANQNQSLENQVDLQDLAYLGPLLTHAHFNNSNDTVTVSNFFDSVTLNVSGNSSGSFEVSSDGVVSSDGLDGTLLSDPAASGTVTVGSNQTLDISAASSATVDFTNTTGTTGALVLDDSKDFSGDVVGFTGDGTTANSDLIDITDVSIADVATSKTTYADHGNGTGTLTLYNANGQALDSINFDGTYQLANFTIESDGNGGTLIVDPPVNTSGQTPGNPPVAPNHHLTGVAAADGFVFNFAGLNHAPTADFHPDLDTFQPGGSMLTNLHTGSNAAPDQGYSNMPLGSDGHDHLGLAGFVKAHLNAADFHFV
jgi:autotransporter-associated beta strand protein